MILDAKNHAWYNKDIVYTDFNLITFLKRKKANLLKGRDAKLKGLKPVNGNGSQLLRKILLQMEDITRLLSFVAVFYYLQEVKNKNTFD